MSAPHPDAWIAGWLAHPEQQRRSWYGFLNLLAGFPEEDYQAQFEAGTIHLARVLSPHDVALYAEAFNKPGAATAAINYYHQLMHDMPMRRFQQPRRLTCPVRVLWGKRDVALSPAMSDVTAQWIDEMEVF